MYLHIRNTLKFFFLFNSHMKVLSLYHLCNLWCSFISPLFFGSNICLIFTFYCQYCLIFIFIVHISCISNMELLFYTSFPSFCSDIFCIANVKVSSPCHLLPCLPSTSNGGGGKYWCTQIFPHHRKIEKQIYPYLF